MNKFAFHIVFLFAVTASWGCTEAITADVPSRTPVKVQSVEAFAASSGLRYSATIRPATQMDLAFKNGGFVDSIHQVSGRPVDKGNVVTKGTVLARVRPADFQDRLDQANSQLLEARAALESMRARMVESRVRFERTQQDFNRAEILFNSQSLTKNNYDAAKAEHDAARAKVDSASADIESAQSRVRGAEAMVSEAKLVLQDTALVAPMSGTILDRTIELGSLVSAGKQAFVLADTSTVKAVFGVPDLEIQTVRPGMLLDITSDAVPEQKFSGRITSVSPAADEKSRIFETEVTIPNPRGVLKAGMIASVVIGGSATPEQIPAVPLSAIVRSKDSAESYAVFVIENPNPAIARLRTVELGDAFGNMIVVKSGLKIGESVITVGTTLVREGETVQIVP
jgi:multidrug efflux system membrane fusion protein